MTSQNEFVEGYDPTLDDSYRKQTQVDGNQYVLEIYDTAGHEDFSAVRDALTKKGDGILCVFSIIDRESFNEVCKIRSHIMEITEATQLPFVICGNKSDLNTLRQVPEKEGNQLGQKLGCTYLEVSAKTRHNIDLAFDTLIREIVKQKKPRQIHEERKLKKKPRSRNCSIS